MKEQAQRYPLTWPANWKRTPAGRQRRAAFKHFRGQLTLDVAITRLSEELRRLGAANELLSTNLPTRLDGRPRGDVRPDDPGAAVYFQLLGKPHCLACDRWDRVADNIGAIAAHIDALRAIDRYGVGTIEQAFAGYTALAPTAIDWWLVLEVRQTATEDEIETAFKRLARKHHPDVGGDHDTMARITAARARALEVRRGT